MDKKEAIEHFCCLASRVAGHFKNAKESDCFCGLNKMAGDNPRIHEDIIFFIEKAVQEKLDKLS